MTDMTDSRALTTAAEEHDQAANHATLIKDLRANNFNDAADYIINLQSLVDGYQMWLAATVLNAGGKVDVGLHDIERVAPGHAVLSIESNWSTGGATISVAT
ncbi:hypothetical protein HNR60_001719 [Rhodopseudomonas rhenobacensis]|uniref:Uncharacterized protein n=1 Tax=Rhodopseudomonas rhenobacensis TaxID=87461 RepID=A0A7W8DYL7_9BRAD|nr:hypothetical protein [Rhodopseudomonas rhenobacensis]MBB5046970.1 hypothetical protein [Rhodopseudomonas rhenobacensis]